MAACSALSFQIQLGVVHGTIRTSQPFPFDQTLFDQALDSNTSFLERLLAFWTVWLNVLVQHLRQSVAVVRTVMADFIQRVEDGTLHAVVSGLEFCLEVHHVSAAL